MTNEEAKKILNPDGDNVWRGAAEVGGVEVVAEACRVAAKALDKQIPHRPDYEGDGYDENGELIYDTWICPCCEEHYEVDYDQHKHCPNCGQAIDWSGGDDEED